ncbi:MAG TPA: Uma2 family endonuclease, partial [Allocoleopsis sp.]
MTTTPIKWTVQDYHRMVDAGILADRHVELLNGEIIEMPPEGIPHANLSTKGANYLRKLLGDRVEIREGKPITLSTQSEPEPDIAVVQPLEDEYFEHHPYPQNVFWLIEFSNSSLEKDLNVKRTTYATDGIQEYWVINLKQMELMVFRSPRNGDYQEQATLTEGVIYPIAFQ